MFVKHVSFSRKAALKIRRKLGDIFEVFFVVVQVVDLKYDLL